MTRAAMGNAYPGYGGRVLPLKEEICADVLARQHAPYPLATAPHGAWESNALMYYSRGFTERDDPDAAGSWMTGAGVTLGSDCQRRTGVTRVKSGAAVPCCLMRDDRQRRHGRGGQHR